MKIVNQCRMLWLFVTDSVKTGWNAAVAQWKYNVHLQKRMKGDFDKCGTMAMPRTCVECDSVTCSHKDEVSSRSINQHTGEIPYKGKS